tara:strand:+ start:262 stop:525 length:264 start_codon:yes stop_codon:yes gene_type:complete
MPKYRYGCKSCNREWWQWSSIGDKLESCPHCEVGIPEKLPVSFVVVQDDIKNKKTAKENVIKHIEENREVLKNMRQDAKKEEGVKND